MLGRQLKGNSVQGYGLHEWTQCGSENWKEGCRETPSNICWVNRRGLCLSRSLRVSCFPLLSHVGQKPTQHKISPTTVRSRENKIIYRNCDNCTTKLPLLFFSPWSCNLQQRNRNKHSYFGAVNSEKEENQCVGRSGGILSKGQFQSMRTQSSLLLRQNTPYHWVFEPAWEFTLRKEPNRAECSGLKIHFRSLCTTWREVFKTRNGVYVTKEKEEHKVTGGVIK